MQEYNIKEKLSESKGITLLVLIVIIVVMLIIVGVSINAGTESLDNTKLEWFYAQLEIIQKRVDDIATTNESYVDSNGNTIYLKEQGTAYENLTTTQKNNLQNIIASEGALLNLTISNFRYFTKGQLESILNLADIDYAVFVDFNSRTIIAEDGININGITYHILNKTIYFVNQDTTKNEGEITSLSFKMTKYGEPYYAYVNIGNTTGVLTTSGPQRYKVSVTPSNTVGDLAKGGTIKYKKSTSKYWEFSNNLEFIINELTVYDVIYTDKNNNEISVQINSWVSSNGTPQITIL